MIKAALLGILTIVTAMAMKQGKAEFATFVSLAGSILIAWAAISLLGGMIGSFERISRFLPMQQEYIGLMLKMTGVTYLSEFAAALCKDAGYSAVAGQIELVGKLTILSIGMPIVFALFELIASMV